MSSNYPIYHGPPDNIPLSAKTQISHIISSEILDLKNNQYSKILPPVGKLYYYPYPVFTVVATNFTTMPHDRFRSNLNNAYNGNATHLDSTTPFLLLNIMEMVEVKSIEQNVNSLTTHIDNAQPIYWYNNNTKPIDCTYIPYDARTIPGPLLNRQYSQIGIEKTTLSITMKIMLKNKIGYITQNISDYSKVDLSCNAANVLPKPLD